MPQLGEKKENAAGTVPGFWDGTKYVPEAVWAKSEKNPANKSGGGSDPTKEEPIKLNIQLPNNRSSSVRYPSDPAAIEADSDYVLFSFYNYAPPFGGGRDTPNRADANSASKSPSNPWGYSNYQDSSDRS